MHISLGWQDHSAAAKPFQFGDDGRPGPTLALRPAASIEGKVFDADGVGGPRIDMGAYERQFVVDTLVDEDDGDQSGIRVNDFAK